MNRRTLAAVAFVITSLGIAVAGCGATPGDSETTSSSTSEAVTATVVCDAPFTYAQPQDCVRNPHGMTCGPAKCEKVTGAPDPAAGIPYASTIYSAISTTTTPTPIAPPSALPGCTWGLQLTITLPDSTTTQANLWACPASSATYVPGTLGLAPACPEGPNGLPSTPRPPVPVGTPCEFDFGGTSIAGNPFVGPTDSDWFFYEEGIEPNSWNPVDDAEDASAPIIAKGCNGGCASVIQ